MPLTLTLQRHFIVTLLYFTILILFELGMDGFAHLPSMTKIVAAFPSGTASTASCNVM